MSTPHVHAEMIKKWADGAEIQWRTGPKLEWRLAPQSPAWLPNFEYRVKPEPKIEKVLTQYYFSPVTAVDIEWTITDGIITDVKLVE